MQPNTIQRRLVRSSTIATAVAMALGSGIATAADKAAETELQEVTVTGSRIQAAGFNAPNPVTVVDRAELDKLGVVNVGEALAQLPSDNAQVSAVNTSVGSVNDYVSGANVGAQLANLRGLNPFFGTRTLTLVDGHRFVPSTNGGAVDLGLVPSNLVSRFEVVTGGASAAYGSDAVAGVVNVVLMHDLQGVRSQIDYSETQRGDGGDLHFALAGGTRLFDGRGHIEAGVEYEDSKAIGACTTTRSWCKPWAIVDVPATSETAYPGYLLTDNARAAVTPGGAIIATTSGPAFTADTLYTDVPASLQNQQFNSAGTALSTWQTGDFISPANRTMVGGDGLPQDFGTKLRVPVQRKIFYSRFQYDLTDNTQGFLEASFGQRNTDNQQVGLQYSLVGTTTSGALIKADNAFLPASVAGLLTGAGKNGFYLNKANLNLPTTTTHSDNKTYRVVTGLNGSLLDTWKWDGYYTYGRNNQEQEVENARIDSRGSTNATGIPRGASVASLNQYSISHFDLALDAVHAVAGDPNSPIVCRATLASTDARTSVYGSVAVRDALNALAQGCVPLNLFGVGNIDPAAAAYAWGNEFEHYHYDQNVVGLNLQGQPIQGWAGPVAVATGVEYRNDKSSTTHDTPEYYFAPDFGGDFAGKTEVVEGYLETQFSLLRDLPAVQALDFDGAYRLTHNKSSSGGVSKSFNINTWKLNLNWTPIDWLRLRATRSKDVRAPSFRELFNPGRDIASFPITNPWTGARDSADLLRFGGGNIDLQPERADTWTIGAVFQPHWGWTDGLRVSADAYRIKLSNGIANTGSGDITGACLADPNDPFCAKITGTPDGNGGFSTITAITTGSLNAQSFLTKGIDFEVAYGLPVGPGKVNVRVLASYLSDMFLEASKAAPARGVTVAQGAVGTNYAGQVGAGGIDDTATFSEAPKWQASSTVGYSLGAFTSTLQIKYVGSAQLYSDLIGPDDPNYPAVFVAGTTANPDRTINVNQVGQYYLFNLSSSYKFSLADERSVEVFGVIRNLLDRKPAIAPPVPPGGGYQPANPVFCYLIGRTFQLGARLKF